MKPATARITYRPGDDTILLRVPGEPRGKGRHRTQALGRGRLRTYTDEATMKAEAHIARVWVDAGSPRINGYVRAQVTAVMSRPLAHFRTSGALSAKGLRTPYPTRKPDIDNLLKLALDALNDRAYSDDALVIDASVCKRWAADDEDPHLLMRLSPVRPYPIPSLPQGPQHV